MYTYAIISFINHQKLIKYLIKFLIHVNASNFPGQGSTHGDVFLPLLAVTQEIVDNEYVCPAVALVSDFHSPNILHIKYVYLCFSQIFTWEGKKVVPPGRNRSKPSQNWGPYQLKKSLDSFSGAETVNQYNLLKCSVKITCIHYFKLPSPYLIMFNAKVNKNVHCLSHLHNLKFNTSSVQSHDRKCWKNSLSCLLYHWVITRLAYTPKRTHKDPLHCCCYSYCFHKVCFGRHQLMKG